MTETHPLWGPWGAEVRRRRQQKGWSQFKLAVASGVTPNTLAKIERGLGGGSDETKMKIARALGVEVSDLFSYPSTTEGEAAS